MVDIVVIGGGPAGLSAAVHAAARHRRCTVITGSIRHNPLYKAERVDNYLGLRGQSGSELLDRMHREALDAGTQFVSGRVISLLPSGDRFLIGTQHDMLEGARLILATGVVRRPALKGEKALLGHGVSYCATCDGMLYRGKRAVVTGNAADLAAETAFLQSIGVEVRIVLGSGDRPALEELPPDIPVMRAKMLEIRGETTVASLLADGEEWPCEAVFVLRETLAPETLLKGLRMNGSFIAVDRQMRTNIPGVFAAGDCTGQPLQIAKAVGEGLIAAQNAVKELEEDKHGKGPTL